MDEQPDGDTPEGQAGGQAGRLAGGQASWQATVFAAMPLRNHAAPAEDLEQGA